MGDEYDESGSNESKIKDKGEKLEGMIREIKIQSSKKKVGKASIPVRLMLIETVLTPTILQNTETWHRINIDEIRMITMIHHSILTRCVDLPRSTPYYGLISELSVLPYIDMIWYKKLLWYHRLVNSSDERVAKRLLLLQMKKYDNWYTELKEYVNKKDIEINVEYIKEITYEKYKNDIKKKIWKSVV